MTLEHTATVPPTSPHADNDRAAERDIIADAPRPGAALEKPRDRPWLKNTASVCAAGSTG